MVSIDAKTRSALIGAWRRVWHRFPTRLQALKQAEVRETPVNKDGRPAKRDHVFYICAQCGTRAKLAASAGYPKAAVDHIDPVIPVDGSVPSFDEIAERMFTTPDRLQVLCEPCHRDKSNSENAERRHQRNANKSS